MVAFRDSEGRYGLIDEFCAHRGASLWFGRNEGSGLRCPYHGWKYDVTGQCIEVPSEADNSSFCQNVQLTSYPLVKIGDVLWTHMGTRPPGPAPEFEWVHVPAEQTYTSKRWQQCNWLQAFEGGIDSSHVTFLHSGGLKTDPLFKGAKGNEYNLKDTKPFFEVADSVGGLFRGRSAQRRGGTVLWRITPWVMPAFTMVRRAVTTRCTALLGADRRRELLDVLLRLPPRAGPHRETERQAMIDGHGVHSKNIPARTGPWPTWTTTI